MNEVEALRLFVFSLFEHLWKFGAIVGGLGLVLILINLIFFRSFSSSVLKSFGTVCISIGATLLILAMLVIIAGGDANILKK